MKRLSLLVVLGFLGSIGAATAATQAVVNFKGKIVATTCEINNKDTLQTVDLGTVYSSDLSSPGDRSTPVPFSVELKECSVGQNVTLGYDGTPYTSTLATPTTLKTTGGADNVGIEVHQVGNVSPLTIGGANVSTQTVTTTGDDLTFNFTANYIATGGGATPGNAQGQATFDVVYP